MPRKARATAVLTVHVPTKLSATLRRMAADNRRTLTAEVVVVLEEGLKALEMPAQPRLRPVA